MKKTVFFILALFMTALSWQGMAQVGSTCGAPLVVASMPFSDTGDTSSYGNNYSSADLPPLAPGAITNGSSHTFYLGGDDVVYSYTAGANGSININASGVAGYSGMFVFTGCPFTSTVGYDVGSGAGTRSIPNLPVLLGQEYFIVISTWPSPESTPFTLNLDGTAPAPPPTCIKPTSLMTTGLSYTSADIGWTPGDSETSWNISWGIPGYTIGVDDLGTDTAATTSYQITGLSAETTYSVYVQADCGSGDESFWSGPLTVYTGYCASVPTSNDNNGISNVQVGTTDYVGSDVTYLDFTGDAPADLAAGLSSNVQITFETGYTYDTNIWIDLNDNLVFEASELLFSGESSNGNPTTLDASFMMPAGAPMGAHRMRIGTADSGQATPNPCYSGSYGVTVDLNINVTAPPSCLPPTALAVNGVTETTADVSWTDQASSSDYDVKYGTPDFDPDTEGTLAAGNATGATLTGLTASTAYEVYARAKCGAGIGGTTSNWTGPVSFSTTQIPAVLPYSDDFSTNQFTFVNGTQTNMWAYGSAAGNPSNSIYISNDSGVTNAYTTSATSVVQAYRDIAIPGSATSAELSLDWRAVGEGFAASKYDYFRVWLVPTTYSPTAGTQITADSGRIQVGDEFNNGSDWQTFTDTQLDVSTFAGQTMRLVFEWRNDSSAGTQPPAAIDNILLEIPTCPAPMNLATTAIGADTADISWTAGGSETDWNISWGDPGYTPGVDDIGNDISSVEAYQITGLTPNTPYEFYVQADCGGDVSTWAGPVSFATLCVVVSDFYEDFEATTGTNLPNCWSKVGTDGNTDTRASTKLSGARVLYTYDDVTVALPVVDNASAGTHQMAMDVIGNFSSGATINLGYLTDPSDASSFVSISSIVTNSTTESQEFATIPTGMPAGDVVFALYAPGGTSSLIDNVRWELIPACPAPTDLASSGETNTTIDVSWTAGNTETAWNISWGAPGYTPGVDDIGTDTANTESYQITGLSASTDYEFYVQADCGGEQSAWAGPASFTTLCSFTTAPYMLDFESVTVPNLPSCTSIETINGTPWKTVSSASGFTGQVLNYSYHPSGTGLADSWFYTQGIELVAGTDYQISYRYGNNSTTWTESMEVAYGTSASSAAMTNSLADHPSINTLTPMDEFITFTVDSDGVYYFGFKSYSIADQNQLYVDDISISEISGFVYNNGTWIPSDPNTNATPADDITVMDGVTSFTADMDVNNVTVMSGATLNVEGILTFNGDLTNNGDLVFVSTATSNGELAAVGGTSTITGDATVQQHMKSKRSYRMVSSAVTTTSSIHDNWQEGATSNTDNPASGFGTHITGTTTDQTNGFDATATGNASMFTVDVPAQQFQAIANTDVNTLTAGNPYLLFVRGDRSIDLSNDLAAGETVLRATGSLVTGTNTQSFASATAGNFVMFGNPYQSGVDINSVFAASTNVNSAFYYVYDPTLGTHGAYVAVDLPSGTNISGSSANQYLQPGQAAQVAVTGAATILFNESDKAPGNFSSTSASPTMGNDMLTVQLYTTENFRSGGPLHDSFGIIFGEGYNNNLTLADAVKPMNFYENLGRDLNGTFVSIERRAMPEPAEVYPLYSAGYAHSDYTLKLTVDGLETNILYLDDHFTGTSTLLEAGENTYSFRVDANDALSITEDRFSIRTEQRLGVDDNNMLAGIRLFPNPLNGDTFYINAPKLNGEQLMVSISDLTGRSIFEQTVDCRANTVTIPMGDNVASGVYLVTLKHGGESNTYRLIKE